jgi:PAS domain S-box-containing protein
MLIEFWLAIIVIAAFTAIYFILARKRYQETIVYLKNVEEKGRQNEQILGVLQATAQRQAQELALLDKVRLALARELDLQAVIRTVVESVADTFGYTLVSLYLLEGDKLVLQHQVGYEKTIQKISLESGICGRVAGTGQPVLLEEVRSDPEFLGAIENILSEVCVPFFDQGKLAGVLNVESTQGVKLTTADLQLMTAISEHVSIAIGRARLYAAIRMSEERYRTLADAAPDAIFIFSLEGELTYINNIGAELFGYPPEELIDHTSDEMPLNIAAFVKKPAFQQVIETKKPFQTEGFIRLNDRSFWYETKLVPVCDPNGIPVAVMGIARDITDRKHTESILEQRANELSALYALGRRINASRSIDEIVQASVEEIEPVIAHDLSLLFLRSGQRLVLRGQGPTNSTYHLNPASVHRVGECLCGLAMKNRKLVFSADISSDPRCTRFECRSAGLHSFAALPLFAENEVIGVLGLASTNEKDFRSASNILETLANQVATGIQSALLHEQERQHAQELEQHVRARTAELEAKNRELETFSYSVSHDLKAPLRGIEGYSTLLLEDCGKQIDEQGRMYLGNIRSGVNKMSQLIDDLLAYSRLERRMVVRKEVNPRQIVDTLTNEWLKNPQNQAVFVVDLPNMTVQADPESLSQALRNLIDNAVKFSRDAPQPRVKISGSENENICVLWVQDNGIGFDMQYVNRIFEIFQRLNRDEEYPGTGIGLAMVRKAMEHMGGRTWAESVPGNGATFYLEIPKK